MLTWFKGHGQRPAGEIEVRSTFSGKLGSPARLDDAQTYVLSGDRQQRVTAAVNTALALRVPLLVGGEPGSGKTQLGYAIANELGRNQPILFVTNSISIASDLFYRYDAVRHFQGSQTGVSAALNGDPRAFISYSALGLAILRALSPSERRAFVDEATAGDWIDKPPHQSVVIIDEVDKAPRDFPNDLLSQLESMRFEVPELGLRTPEIATSLTPIVVITTNSERQLPDAFLRRCAFVQVEPPMGEDLEAILIAKFAAAIGTEYELLIDTVAFHGILRNSGLEKNPSTSELLQFFLALLLSDAELDRPLSAQKHLAIAALSLLAKHPGDQARVEDILHMWGNKD